MLPTFVPSHERLRNEHESSGTELVKPSSVRSLHEPSSRGARAHVRVPDDGTYRADVEGLRAVAVVSVMIYHMQHEWLPGGFVGVDIFFVISGYVVTGSLLRHQSRSLGALVSSFYARRIKRLTPALVVMVLTISIAMSFMLDPDVTEELDYYVRTAQVALLGGSNIMFSLQGTSYFANAENEMKTEFNPFTHTWSLGAEEQFYFLFPTIIALAYGQRATQRLPRCLQWAELGPSVSPMRLLAGTAYLSVLFCAYASLTNGMSMVAFYLLPSRFWQMMIGAMLYHAGASWVPPEGTSDSPAKKAMCSSCSLASLMYAAEASFTAQDCEVLISRAPMWQVGPCHSSAFRVCLRTHRGWQ